VCRICYQSWKEARINLGDLLKKDENNVTSIERIYIKYAESLSKKDNLEVPLNMEDLFPEDKNNDKKEEERKRIAVWASDVNSMGDRLPLWISQEEDNIQKTFDRLKDFIIDVLSETLIEVFPEKTLIKKGDGTIYIPFRLIVAGGDDLFIVMPHRFIVDFALTYSRIMGDKAANISKYSDTLQKNMALKNKAKKRRKRMGGQRFWSFMTCPLVASFIVP
jgi:CRISPR/Cas system-associated protein Cas10 (large subunit of type III CRISPR-Cas system)